MPENTIAITQFQLSPSYKLSNSRKWRRSDIVRWIEWGMPNLDDFVNRCKNLNK